jgi:hypothetical protein
MNPLAAGHLLTRTGEMERALERGERRSVELRAFFGDLDTALRDSGPAEIGISAKAFNAALSHCRRAQELLNADLTPRAAQALEQVLRRLRRVFRRAEPIGSRGRGRTVSSGLAIAIAAAPALALIAARVEHGFTEPGPSALNAVTVLAVMAIPGVWYLLRRSDPSELEQVVALRASVAPEERLLHWFSIPGWRHPVHRVWFVTDRRVLLAEPNRGDKPARILTNVEHKHLRTLNSVDLPPHGEAGKMTRVELHDGEQQVELTLSPAEAAAMLTTLERRTGLPVDRRTEGSLEQVTKFARTLRR